MLRLFLLVLMLAATPAFGAEPYTVPGSKIHRLVASNGVDYELYVRTPKGYGERPGSYTTLYLLDADYSFPLVHAVAEHFEDRRNMPRVILVGIAYPGGAEDTHTYRMNRTRDYTPTQTPEGGYGPAYQAVSGGADAFLGVISGDIIPFIEGAYQASGNRALVGHSYGGLFASYVMLTKPAVFSRYLIVSPSLWYDEKMIFKVEEAYAARRIGALPVRAYFAVGAHENQPQNGRAMVDDLRELQQRLAARGYTGFRSSLQVFEGETHNSVFPAAVSRGLRVLLGNQR